jgi:hypothetical protein
MLNEFTSHVRNGHGYVEHIIEKEKDNHETQGIEYAVDKSTGHLSMSKD